MPRILIPLLLIFLAVSCNKTSVSDREQGSSGAPEDVPCHFVCTDANIPDDDNVVVCQECDDGDLPFCAELDFEDSVIYCTNTLKTG